MSEKCRFSNSLLSFSQTWLTIVSWWFI